MLYFSYNIPLFYVGSRPQSHTQSGVRICNTIQTFCYSRSLRSLIWVVSVTTCPMWTYMSFLKEIKCIRKTYLREVISWCTPIREGFVSSRLSYKCLIIMKTSVRGITLTVPTKLCLALVYFYLVCTLQLQHPSK